MNTTSTTVQRLRIYFREGDHWHGASLGMALLENLHQAGLARAALFRGLAGFDAHGPIHTATLELLSQDLPLCLEAIDAPEKIAQWLEQARPLLARTWITLEDARLVHAPQEARDFESVEDG